MSDSGSSAAIPTARNQQAAERGVSLIEAVVASMVLAVGAVGAWNGILFALFQNGHASRATRASAIAHQVKVGLMGQGLRRLIDVNGVLASPCSTAPATRALAGDVEAVVPCIIDLDAYETGALADLRVTPGYSQEDQDVFRRVLAYTPPGAPGEPFHQIAIVVSWQAGARRWSQTLVLGMYDPSAGATPLGVEL